MRLRVLVACEFSGRVRDAFRARGFDAWSCDVRPTETRDQRYHIYGDVLKVLRDRWHLMIAFPPCTYLASSGSRWWRQREQEQFEAVQFVRRLLGAPIPHIALENPKGCLSTWIRPPDQMVEPWQFGDPYTKRTCLWLKRLPILQATDEVWPDYEATFHGKANQPGPSRGRERSRTFHGLASAMADQWGRWIRKEQRG